MPSGLPPADIAFPSLLSMRSDGAGSRFVPKLGDGPPTYFFVSFEDWWKNELIYQERASGQLNCMCLVYALRHQDGGGGMRNSHRLVLYIHLKKGAGWQLNHSDGRVEPVSNLVAASMRQVAWEMMETLKQLGSDLQ